MQQRVFNKDIATKLVREGLHPILARVLSARGIESLDMLSGEIGDILPFTSMKGIDRAATILARVVTKDVHTVISCDFDVDGCTAGAVAYRALRMMGATKIDIKMPNRSRHGYGVSKLLVQELAEEFSPELILTVDCGISSYEGIEEAKKHQISVLITDHHLPANDKALPVALGIVNPNQPGCEFESKALCGCGVIFYVMLALRAKLREMNYFTERNIPEPNLGSLLDLVALATIADVVKLCRNNRILVRAGLRRIKNGQACPGINALLKVAGKDYSKVSVFDMSFVCGPRLNAAGRMDDMMLGMRCLLSDDPQEALSIAKELDRINTERRAVESDMKESAEIELEEIDVSNQYSLVMHDPSWHQGVIGILASRLKDKYGRPTIILASADGKVKGSGRSIPGLHLRDAIDLVAKRNPGMLLAYGGHSAAAGLTLVEGRAGDFAQAFEEVVSELLTEADLQQIVETDGSLSAGDFTVELARTLENAIWGQGFPAPLFNDTFDIVEQKILKEKHLKMKLSKDGKMFDAIWFFQPDLIESASGNFVYSLSVNEFNGNVNVQMMVRDMF
ncbi:MAG: single-stranded-DNA-specific exonuclease RecJ [Methylococcaceae bacterium]